MIKTKKALHKEEPVLSNELFSEVQMAFLESSLSVTFKDNEFNCFVLSLML